jgi:hypothetical protein
MNIYKIYFYIIFSIIKKQNEFLLKRISTQENIDGNLLKEFIPSKTELKSWYKNYSSSSSSSSSSS